MINPGRVAELSAKYEGYVSQSYIDIQEVSGLHSHFIEDCIESIEAKKRSEGRLPIGEMFPLIVAEGMSIPPDRKRLLAAACLALHGYTRLVDSHLDQYGVLNSRNSMTASALLSWGIAIMSEATAGTPYAGVFLKNVTAAISAQHNDLLHRNESEFDRRGTDVDKNRAIVATVAAFCAASANSDGRLVRATELLLAPFQSLDDLADLPEDILEGNITSFVKIATGLGVSLATLRSMPSRDTYQLVVMDPRAQSELLNVASGLFDAMTALKPDTDADLLLYLAYLRQATLTLVSSIESYRINSKVSLADIEQQIRALRVDV